MTDPQLHQDDRPRYNKDPFRLLKAILIGAGLGFIVVSIAPHLAHLSAPRLWSPAEDRQLAKIEERPQAKITAPPRMTQAPQADAEKHTPAAAPVRSEEKPRQTEEPAAAPEEKPIATEDKPKEASAPRAEDKASVKEENVPASEMKQGALPSLVPAVKVSFPKPFAAEDMATALKPLIDYRVSDADAALLKEIYRNGRNGEAIQASLAKIENPVAQKLARWTSLRSNPTLEAIRAFRKANPEFPALTLDAEAEGALFLSDATAEEVLKFFANRKPLTAAGRASLGAALVEKGERERGNALLTDVWTHSELSAEAEANFKKRHADLLDDAIKSKRLEWIALRAKLKEAKAKSAENNKAERGLRAIARYRSRNSGRATVTASRLRYLHERGQTRRVRGGAPRRSRRGTSRASLDEPLQTLAAQSAGQGDGQKASLLENVAYRRPHRPMRAAKKESKPPLTPQQKAAAQALKLAKEVQATPDALLQRLKGLRRANQDRKLWSLLRSIKPERGDIAAPERWWDFRRTEVRRALNKGLNATAYAIATRHFALDEENRADAEFLSGWIAFRFLKDNNLAEAHFKASSVPNGSVRDAARAAYWLGKLKEATGRTGEALFYYRRAAPVFYLFYGQLAKQALHETRPCLFRAPENPSASEIKDFVENDAFRAFAVMKQADLLPLMTIYALEVARQLDSPKTMTLFLELLERVAPPQLAVRAAKIALLRGFAVEAYAYPVLLPQYDMSGDKGKIEFAFLNALTRQESEFNTGTVSGVGAKGLMQLMPQTAKLVAASQKMKYDAGRLISDPSYNVTLGAAFLADLLNGYDGSYIMALAAYNAGPGRVTQWVKAFGDPRSRSVDPVDWVERIPFTETHDYVQKIMESLQLYRCRISPEKTALQLFEDLHRGRPGKLPEIGPVSGTADAEEEETP
jgi:soluble lytic murein transglycosylase